MSKSVSSALAPNDSPISGEGSQFLTLKVHAHIDFQLRLAMEGVESSALIGEKGTGKTLAIKMLTERIEREEILAAPAESRHVRNIVRFTASDATGVKTLLVDLYNAVNSTKLTGAALRATSPRELAELLALQCADRNIRLLVIDEAQKVNAHNLDQLREVPDRAREHGHAMGIMLIGNPKLRAALAASGELGQRFATVIAMPLIDRRFISENLETLSPDLARLRKELGKEWPQLEETLTRKVDGKLRRLTTIIANTALLSRRLDRPVDALILRNAIDKLSPEV